MVRASVNMELKDFNKFINSIQHEVFLEGEMLYIETLFNTYNKKKYYIATYFDKSKRCTYFKTTVNINRLWYDKGVLKIVTQLAKNKGIKVTKGPKEKQLYFELTCRYKHQQANYMSKLEQLLMECDFMNYKDFCIDYIYSDI